MWLELKTLLDPASTRMPVAAEPVTVLFATRAVAYGLPEVDSRMPQ